MKLNYPKDWFERSAAVEGIAEIGAGLSAEFSPQDAVAAAPAAAPTPAVSNIPFGRFVALWRRNMGIDAEKFALQCGLDPEEIIEIEQDPTYEPEPSAVFKLAKVFNLPSRGLMEMAGLIEAKTSTLRQEAVRFAARSAPVANLHPSEKDALEAMVYALTKVDQD
jgi:transcriptional regulator with XRE-family HTH domain